MCQKCKYVIKLDMQGKCRLITNISKSGTVDNLVKIVTGKASVYSLL